MFHPPLSLTSFRTPAKYSILSSLPFSASFCWKLLMSAAQVEAAGRQEGRRVGWRAEAGGREAGSWRAETSKLAEGRA